MTDGEKRDFGALVGWKSQDLGDRVMLCMQSIDDPTRRSPNDVHAFHFIINKTQCIQLGHHMYRMSEATPPSPAKRRGLLRRLLRF